LLLSVRVYDKPFRRVDLLTYLLYGLFIAACAVLIVVVLLQPGKADAGALFTSSVSSTAFGPRGTQNILARITIGAAVAFMLLALLLSLPGINGSHSALQSETLPAVSPQPSPSVASVPVTVSSPSPAASVAADGNKKPAASPAAQKSPKK
jgi:preprotein translocase subunit SecG